MPDSDAYNPTLTEILTVDPCRPLTAGTPNAQLSARLRSVKLEELFAPRRIVNREAADLCLAGLWLLADDLTASHIISQQYETPTGSFWHGIMHRREGDFENAKYWFRRVGQHPVFDTLLPAAQRAAEAAPASPAREQLLAEKSWDPYLFVDLCAAGVRKESPSAALCRLVAQAEWQLLFRYCHAQACG